MTEVRDIETRLAALIPDPALRVAVVAEIAEVEAELLAVRCDARPCPEKDMGGECAECPMSQSVLGRYRPEPEDGS